MVTHVRLERTHERKVVAWCKKKNLLTTKLAGQGQRGKPDRVFWFDLGTAVLMEFKREGAVVRKLQLHNQKIYQELGFDYYIVYSAEQAVKILEGYLDG